MKPFRSLITGLVCLLLVVGTGQAHAAGVETVAAYKHRVNSLCVAATPKLVTSTRAAKRASTQPELSAAFDRYVAIALDLDKAILRIPVPVAVRADLAPLLRLTRQGDALVVRVADALRAGNVVLFTQFRAQLEEIGKKYDPIADALGLRGCGSDLTRALNHA